MRATRTITSIAPYVPSRAHQRLSSMRQGAGPAERAAGGELDADDQPEAEAGEPEGDERGPVERLGAGGPARARAQHLRASARGRPAAHVITMGGEPVNRV